MCPAYYNEIHPGKAAAIRELVKHGIIAPGEVDERSVEDVRPADLEGFAQCHFFAGIAVWSYALRLAGWPDDRPVWTASCPCQPFSSAGKGKTDSDDRHLWPAWFRLIAECKPDVCFGEQVSSADGLAWIDHVRLDLEDAGYAIGILSTNACGVGAPHLRQRLYFVADATSMGPRRGRTGETIFEPGEVERPWGCGDTRLLVQPIGPRIGGGDQRGSETPRQEIQEHENGPNPAIEPRHGGEDTGLLVHATGSGCETAREQTTQQSKDVNPRGPTNGFWSDTLWIPCRDGKWRATQSGIFPLAHGAPARVLRLHCYGDCIVAPQAEAFVRAYREVENK